MKTGRNNVPLICYDTRSGTITRYQRSEYSHVPGVRAPLVAKRAQVPADWMTKLGDDKVWPMLEGFRKTGAV